MKNQSIQSKISFDLWSNESQIWIRNLVIFSIQVFVNVTRLSRGSRNHYCFFFYPRLLRRFLCSILLFLSDCCTGKSDDNCKTLSRFEVLMPWRMSVGREILTSCREVKKNIGPDEFPSWLDYSYILYNLPRENKRVEQLSHGAQLLLEVLTIFRTMRSRNDRRWSWIS